MHAAAAQLLQGIVESTTPQSSGVWDGQGKPRAIRWLALPASLA